ncbi:MAG: hypothetical protein SFU83_23620 [Meiothermus sp.]|nr:hypothetical protein [Meiothermus sp.]
MMTYRVYLADNIDELERKVNAALGQGWVPRGGVAVACLVIGTHHYCQAMTKVDYTPQEIEKLLEADSKAERHPRFVTPAQSGLTVGWIEDL